MMQGDTQWSPWKWTKPFWNSPNLAEIPPPSLFSPLSPLHFATEFQTTASWCFLYHFVAYNYNFQPTTPLYNSHILPPSPQKSQPLQPTPASQAGVPRASLGKSEDPREQGGLPRGHGSHDQHQAPRRHCDGHVRQDHRVGPGEAGVGHGNPGSKGLGTAKVEKQRETTVNISIIRIKVAEFPW